MHHPKRTIRFATAVIVIASIGVACSSSSTKAACENVTNKDLLQAIAAPAASSVNAGHKLGNNDGYYVARADGALWVTSFPPVSNGDTAGLIVPLNPQARLDAPDVGVDVPPNAPILKDFSDTDSRATTAVGCASASPSSG